jgi:hypothetical protein
MATLGSPILTSGDNTTNKDVFKKLLRAIFDSTERAAIVEYPEVMRDIQVNDLYERELRMAGLYLANAVNEGSPIQIQAPKIGLTKEFTQTQWGTGFRVSLMMKKFNKWQLIESWTRDLKKVMQETKDITVARIYNYANVTTYCTGFDGYQLAYDSHTCLDTAASTWDNKTTSALSLTALESAYIYFDTLIDDQGLKYYVRPTKLIVPPALQIKARQLVGTDRVPFTADNTKNIAPEWDLKVFVYHRMTDTNDWFLTAPDEKNFGPRVFTSMDADLQTHDAYDDSRDTVVTSMMLFTYGFGDGRLVYAGIV